MSGPEDQGPDQTPGEAAGGMGGGAPDEQRTVFMPSIPPASPDPGPAAQGPAEPPPFASAAPVPTAPLGWGPTEPPQFTAMPGGSFAASGAQPRQVQVGDVLNHLYEVRRFIARGGMGEVFEGVNINSEDERVAIKVILPHLASDPSVLAMFRKEARTLTRLSHPALVQYRTLAQEPQLGVYYIVTEYIDGRNMSDLLGQLKPSPAELAGLIRRLAEGLAVAHSLGAIHRDISPDNVMLEGGQLGGAKVIDFGIAKDLDAGSQTIVGDGFAGKLNYVAPEQLGDFDRAVGAWTDVYSLGLTILAVINGRDVNMGGSLVDAVDKRRAGPDLSAVPGELRPVLEGMLRPNPQERFRSMPAVVDALVRGGTSAPAPAAPSAAPAGASKLKAGGAGLRLSRPALLAGGGLLAAVLLAGLGWALWPAGEPEPEAATAAPVGAAGIDPLATARQALQGGVAQIQCAWLDVADLQVRGTEVAVALRGVAGDPVKAQNQVGQLLQAKGLKAASIDSSDVQQISPADCSGLEAFRQIRSTGAAHLAPAQPKFEMNVLPPESAEAGKLGATAVLELDLNGLVGDFALVGIEDSGKMTLIDGLSPQVLAQAGYGVPGKANVYRLPLETTHKGWSGIALLSGRGPFDKTLLGGEAGSHGPEWAGQFLSRARAQGWQAEMVWYKTVDELPNGKASAAAGAGAGAAPAPAPAA